ncbi:MAG: carboxypeptidase-like regulatory domain-containing protein [Pseudoflavonifractor sp.]|nr:carboxypeptidase-like regulatory domain-containing protein [Pseudoflavonifractor sp.]
MFLAGNDSVLVTYAVTDANGAFKIPCDRKNIIAKVSCVGYRTRSFVPESLDLGNITMINLPIKLKGVSVTADDVHMLSDRTVYMPSSRQKNSAMDAVDLLRAMAIPQINVGPGGELSDMAGESVKVFINSLPASEEEQKGLRTADVRRVEYIQYPTDARYGGARKVINFIVHQYEYGGYTKGSVD